MLEHARHPARVWCRRVVALLVGLAVALTAMTLPAHANDRDDYDATLGSPPDQLRPRALLGHEWVGDGSGISGDAVLSRGELILDDRPFDDTGEDTEPGNGTGVTTAVDAATLTGLCAWGLAYQVGDLVYPTAAEYGAGSSDLVQVRLAADKNTLHVLWQLEALMAPTTTSVSLLIDTDADAATGAAGGFTGFDSVVVVENGAASFDGKPVTSAVDLDGNTIEAAVPLTSLSKGPWRVNAIASVLPATPTQALADAAFVPEEPVVKPAGCRLDAVQSGRLARRDLQGALVDPARLARGASDPAVLRRGAFTRSYPPRLKLGEGHAPQPRYGQDSSAKIYRGTVQPYSVYVPASYDPRRENPVILLLHCLTCWHTVYGIASMPGVQALADARGALIVTPFGYGEGGHYEGEAQTDAFEVLSDVSRRYSVDQDRLYLTGMSMGSLGTYRLGGLFPDMWARLLAVESYTTPECESPDPSNPPCSIPFNYLDLFPSFRNIPTGIIQGTLDELTPVTGGRLFADRLTSFGYPFRYWEWLNRTHDPRMHGLTTDVTDPFLGDGRREKAPGTVTYVMDRAMQTPGQVYDRAYWLSDLVLAQDERFGRVDATSDALPGFTTRPVAGSGTDDAGPWTMRGLDATPTAAPSENKLTLTLRGLKAATVDLDTAGLTLHRPLTLVSDTDRAVTLDLGGRTVSLPAGRNTQVVIGTGQRSEAEVRAVPLPATGGAGSGLPAVLLLGLALGMRVLRRTVR